MNAPKTKRGKILLSLVIVVILLGSPGCATRHARSQPGLGWSTSPPAYRDQPHLYPATRYTWDGRVARHGLHGKLSRAIEEETARRQGSAWLISGDALFYSLFVGVPVLFVTGTCTFIVELPVSLISDTLMIPSDLAAIRRYEADGAFLEEALLGSGWPVTAEELRRRYRPANANPVIREFLEQPETPAFADKILLLIETDVGLPVIAAAAHLDAHTANRLVEHVADEPHYRRVLERLAQNPDIPDETLMRLATLSLTPPHRYLQPLLADNPSASTAHLETLLPPDIEEAKLPHETLNAMEKIAAHPAVSETLLTRLAESPAPGVFHAVSANPNTPVEALAGMADRGIHAAQRRLVEHPDATPEQLETLSRLDRPDLLSSIAVHPAATPETLLWLERGVDARARRGRDMALRLARHPATPPEALYRLSEWEDAEIDTALARHADTPAETITIIAGRAEGGTMAGRRLMHALAGNPYAPEWFLLERSEEAGGRSPSELRRALVGNPATPSAGLLHFVEDLRIGLELLQHPNVTAEVVEGAAIAACHPGWVMYGDEPPPLVVLEAAARHPLVTREALVQMNKRVEVLERGSTRERYPGRLRAIQRSLQEAEARFE